jgi:hypothetical protein
MINTINDLRRLWTARREDLDARIAEASHGFGVEPLRVERETLDRCILELAASASAVDPPPLTEASNERLHRWAGRMVVILDAVRKANSGGADEAGYDLMLPDKRDLQPLMNDMYDLFKNLANRPARPARVERPNLGELLERLRLPKSDPSRPMPPTTEEGQ